MRLAQAVASSDDDFPGGTGVKRMGRTAAPVRADAIAKRGTRCVVCLWPARVDAAAVATARRRATSGCRCHRRPRWRWPCRMVPACGSGSRNDPHKRRTRTDRSQPAHLASFEIRHRTPSGLVGRDSQCAGHSSRWANVRNARFNARRSSQRVRRARRAGTVQY